MPRPRVPYTQENALTYLQELQGKRLEYGKARYARDYNKDERYTAEARARSRVTYFTNQGCPEKAIEEVKWQKKLKDDGSMAISKDTIQQICITMVERQRRKREASGAGEVVNPAEHVQGAPHGLGEGQQLPAPAAAPEPVEVVAGESLADVVVGHAYA